MNENIEGRGKKLYLSEMRLCTREDYQRLDRKEDDHPTDSG